MIDIDLAKHKFEEYVKNYDIKDKDIAVKYYHSLRVCDLSKNIAMSLGLPQEDIFLASLIGLLHDIGRFYQDEHYGNFYDYQTKDHFDHAEYAVNLLFDENLIRNFIEDEKYDEIIMKAIYSHNKYSIMYTNDELELLFCKIIRDADKIDILYQVAFDKELIEVTDETISEPVLDLILNKQEINMNFVNSQLDELLLTIGLIFDINYGYSFYLIRENKYIETIIYKLNVKEEKTKQILKEIEKKVLNYINQKLGGSENGEKIQS